jgi:hypothetical protein
MPALPSVLQDVLPALDEPLKSLCIDRFARCARFIHSRRAEWCLVHSSPGGLRLFCGKNVAVTIEKRQVWLATDARWSPAWADDLASFRWYDGPGADGPNGRYRIPPSKNGWYDPLADPGGLEWGQVEAAHHAWIEATVRDGRGPAKGSVRDHRADLLEALTNLPWGEGATASDQPSVESARPRTLSAVLARPEQARFRSDLMAAYGGQCALTGCRAPAALEAAHIVPVSEGGLDRVDNGLLLRADVHRLYDAGLLRVDPEDRSVSLDSSIVGSGYDQWAGQVLTTPAKPSEAPSETTLRHRRRLLDG